jgi:hypothetical protein
LRGENEFNTVVKVFGYLPFVSLLSIGLIYVPILFHAIYGLMVVAEMQGPGGNISDLTATRATFCTRSSAVGGSCAAVHRLSRVLDQCDAQIVRVRRGRWACGRQRGRALSGFPGHRLRRDAVALRKRGLHRFLRVRHRHGRVPLRQRLFNFGIRWGITIGAQAQKISAMIWAGLGVGLFVVGAWTAINFHVKSLDYKGTGQSIRSVYPQFDTLVKTEPAPANPKPAPSPTATRIRRRFNRF